MTAQQQRNSTPSYKLSVASVVVMVMLLAGLFPMSRITTHIKNETSENNASPAITNDGPPIMAENVEMTVPITE